jgi:hypothetical protein
MSGTPVPTVEYTISTMPLCPGIEKLSSPLQFTWPNMDAALEKLADYSWGYYRCPMSQPELLAFAQSTMPRPPYLWREVNHAEHEGGIVVLYYQATSWTWMYVWMLPGPDAQSAYLVIARGDPGMAQTWECRLPNPPRVGTTRGDL